MQSRRRAPPTREVAGDRNASPMGGATCCAVACSFMRWTLLLPTSMPFAAFASSARRQASYRCSASAPLEDLLRRQVRNHGRCRLFPAALDSAALGGRKRVDLGRLAIGGRRVGGAKGHDGRRLHRQRSVGMGVPMKRSLRTARAFPTEIRQNLAQISLRDVATLSGNHRRDDAQGKVLRT